ncbi:MAG TPA: hydantoinase B/oxoprolinase family protein [Gaiellaceae bacterium]|nr:hydantoinase B/oxoprolinase family protein [Gaiellaceae bacterium]
MTTTSSPPEAALARGDAFTLEIIRSYLISTVREMAEATKRTAYSTVISEALDFTCGLFDRDGNMIAQSEGIPLHAGSLPGGMRALLDAFDDFSEGDVFLLSDPYIAGLHQADVIVARPLFHDGGLFAFGVNRAHWLDIGGMAAGGWAGTATHVVQEGLRIPPIRLIHAGVVDEPLRALIFSNVRLPVADWADFQSQVASTVVAERRIQALIERYGKETVERGMASALEYSRTRFRRALDGLPDGEWRAEEPFEDDGQGGGPYYLRVTLTKREGRIVADFSESDPQVAAPINASEITTHSAAYVACVAALDPDVPLNSGLLEFIEVVTRPGTVAHAVFPAPVFFSTADPCIKAGETVLKAFAQAIPDRITAGSFQTGNNVTGSGSDAAGRPFQWFSFGPGGIGARKTADGDSAEWHVMANCKNESAEIWEHRYPLLFEEFSLIPDSCGRGRFRGGLGLRKRMRMLSRTLISSTADRQELGPWSIDAGERGLANRYSVVDTEGRLHALKDYFSLSSNSKFANLPLQPGEQLVIDSAGGGGHGPIEERDPALLDRDVEYGYATRKGWAAPGRRPDDL